MSVPLDEFFASLRTVVASDPVKAQGAWPALDTWRSYERLAPLDESDLARVKLWGPDADAGAPPDRYVGLS